MSALPSGWSRAALGEVCAIVSGATPKTAVAANWGGDIRWVTPDDLSKDRSQTIAGGARSLSQSGYDSCSAKLFPAGSVVFSSRAPVGYVAIAGHEMCTNQGCKTAVPPDYIDSRYLYWYLRWMTPDIASRASGTTFKEISGKRFAETELRWPPIEEQRRIVEALEGHLSRVEAADRLLREAEARSQQMWAACLESAEALDEGDPIRIADVADAIRGVTYKKPEAAALGGPGLIPLLRATDFDDGRILDHPPIWVPLSRVSPEQRLQPGDSLIASSSGSLSVVGKSAVIEGFQRDTTFGAFCMILRPSAKIDPKFLSFWIRRPSVRRSWSALAAGTNINNLKARDVLGTHIVLPGIAAQKSWVNRVSEAESAVTGIRTAILRQRQHAASLRASLLSAAFNGRLSIQGTTGRRRENPVHG